MNEQQRKEAVDKFIAGLAPHRDYLLQHGQRMHKLYPLDKMRPEVFEQITVPVALPVAMMLFGLGTTMIATEVEATAKEVSDAQS